MVLWVVPGCPSSTRLCRHWDLVTLLFLLFFATGTLIKSSRSQNSHHYTTHTVSTKYGSLRGVKLQFSSSAARHLDPVNAYLGIPYASPPVNAYRFMPPVAPLPWGGTRLAVTLPPACPQKFPDVSNRTKVLQTMTVQRYQLIQKLIPHLANQSEDCLYLNVYVPTVPSGEEIRPGKFAVVLVIHGESWEWGSGNEFDGGALASLGNHIVVTFNYRLGILGFLKTSNQQSNFGLLDVIAALHWVRENGDSFGGDRNRITLLGYRTGAVIANLLLVAQIAKGLFQRAILISGSVLSPWALQRRPEDIASQVSAHLGCVGRLPLSHPESDLAPCLRRKHLSDLLNFVPDSPRFLPPFAPYVDNILIRNPKSMMEGELSEQFLRSQILLMFTTSEGVHELSSSELKNGFESEHRDRILRTLVRNVFTFHQQEIFSIVRNEYTDWERPILHPIPLKDATVEALSDCLVIGPALQVALIHSRRKGKTYVLHFSHVHTSKMDSDHSPYKRLGSLEGDVVPYVMGLPVTNNVPALGGQQYVSPWSSIANFSKQDAVVSETLVHYASNFAKSGDPNVNEPPVLLSLAGNQDGAIIGSGGGSSGGSSRERLRLRSLHWDLYEPGSQTYMELGIKPKIRSHYRSHKMALWLNLIPQIHLPGGSDVSLAHHAFQDDNPNLYVGPVRPLLPYTLGDPIPGFGLAPGVGIVVSGNNSAAGVGVGGGGGGGIGQQQQTASPGNTLTTTECLESTEPPLTQGTRHSVRIDSNEVEVEIRGGGGGVGGSGGEPGAPLSSSPNAGGIAGLGNGEYDYTTALTVTLTVGVCLILLNLVVFSAIMCHRKRGFNIPVNLVDNGSRQSSHSGTPQKSTYQDEYKWTPCCSSSMNPEFGMGQLYGGGGESIAMNQFPVGIPPSREHTLMSGGGGGVCTGGGGGSGGTTSAECNSSPSGTLMRSPRSSSPLMGLGSPASIHRNPHHSHGHHRQHHPSCHTLQQQQQQGPGVGLPPPQPQYSGASGGGGTLKRAQASGNCQQLQQQILHQPPMSMAIPDFIQTVGPPNPNMNMTGGCMMVDAEEFVHDINEPIPESAIRLYMNQVAGDNLVLESSEPCRPSTMSRRPSCSASTSPGCGVPGTASSTSSSTCTTATNTAASNVSNNPPGSTSNPSPSSGNTSLVGVLKRHTSTTPNSTVKKRVQIQEISV